MNKDEIKNELTAIVKCPLTGNLISNYKNIRDIFITKYILVELEPLRIENCYCLIIGLNQASITLTNHLLEKFLLNTLIYKECIDKKNNKENRSFDRYFEDEINELNDLTLEKKINKAFEKGLITEDNKTDFHNFRDCFRNAYSHSNIKKTFGNSNIPAHIFKIKDDNTIELEKEIEINVAANIVVQGLVQQKKAELDAANYFKYVDSVIRQTSKILFKNITQFG